MPIARVQMPDGRIGRFEVPDGTSPEDAKAMIEQGISRTPRQAELKQGPLDFIEQATSNVSPVNDPSKMADISSQATGSLPKNIRDRAAFFAKRRFPNDPNAIARYGVQDGRLFYEADDGKYYYEEPKASLNPSEAARYVASGVGPGITTGGAIAGGVATGPAGGVPGAIIGGAAGDEIRQALAMMFAGQPRYNPSQTWGEGAIAGAGQIGGRAAVGTFNRHAAPDIARIQTKEAQTAINDLMKKSQQEGIPLTPAEMTNLRSLKAEQNFLGDSPRSADIMGDFYTKRNTEQVPAAVERMLGKISPTESAEVGARNLQQGAEGAIKTQMAERVAASSPLYKEVFPKRVAPTHIQSLAQNNNLIRNAINGARRDPVTKFYIEKYEKETGAKITNNSVGFLDAVKQSLDGKASAALRSGNQKEADAYTESAVQLREMIDRTVPAYKEARAAYAGESPAVSALKEGEIGLAANAKQTNLERIPKMIFESGPKAVQENRAAFMRAGKEKEWNDGLRSYLQSAFDQASKEFKTGNVNPGASFRAKVFGTAKQKSALKSAMSNEQWAGFNRLMDVLEASGRVTQGGSRTHFAGAMAENMKGDATKGVVGQTIKTASNPFAIPARIRAAYEDMRLGKYTEEMASVITSPEGMKELKRLKALDPRSARAMVITSQILTQFGIGALSQPSDAPAGGFSSPQTGQ